MTMTIVEPARDDRAAIDKAFSLLVAFGSDAATGLGVSELARRTRLSKSTAFRVLGMLERNAMVERVGKNYRLGAPGRVIPAPSVNNGMNPAPADQVPGTPPPVSDPLKRPGSGTVECNGQQPNPCVYTPASSSAIYSPQSGELIGPDGVKYSVENSSHTGDRAVQFGLDAAIDDAESAAADLVGIVESGRMQLRGDGETHVALRRERIGVRHRLPAIHPVAASAYPREQGI